MLRQSVMSLSSAKYESYGMQIIKGNFNLKLF